jgi:hypothetical protein
MSITKIAEQMVRREYAKQNITLPAKFWNIPQFKPSYRRQMQLASKFVRAYGIDAVQSVIDREAWAYSLAPKCLPDMMEIEATRLNQIKINSEIIKNRPKEGLSDTDDTNIPVFRAKPVANKRLLDE